MTSYYVEFSFDMGQPVDEALEAHLDDVAEALAAIADVDGDVGVDLKAGRVDLCMTINAENRDEASMKAFVAARTAVHAAGGQTGSWDGWLPELLEADKYRSMVTPSSLGRDYALGC
ncbi:hypothetical protein BN000_02182 [Mycobacterium europaeum]|uniref:Uncharacterized protein n=1 Tax=Mycobacterium europaeum TaxID=761804 RepID=A0A0U1DAP7_9MYCO|nr:hypothetical protein [Mycobacterium europaeum]CQD10574.1 hypothetical protein BN000_02182 [Mycobacterium europaeum]